MIEKFGKDEAWDIAAVFAFRGEVGPAFERLEKASQEPGVTGF